MGGCAAALPERCFAIFRKNANLANPLTSDARSVMLRIPLPEDDGFALCTASVKCGNVKMLPIPMLPIPIAPAAEPPLFSN